MLEQSEIVGNVMDFRRLDVHNQGLALAAQSCDIVIHPNYSHVHTQLTGVFSKKKSVGRMLLESSVKVVDVPKRTRAQQLLATNNQQHRYIS